MKTVFKPSPLLLGVFVADLTGLFNYILITTCPYEAIICVTVMVQDQGNRYHNLLFFYLLSNNRTVLFNRTLHEGTQQTTNLYMSDK